MLKCFSMTKGRGKVVPLIAVIKSEFGAWFSKQPLSTQRSLETFKFKAEAGQFAWLTDSAGRLEKVFIGMNTLQDSAVFRMLPLRLPEGLYRLTGDFSSEFLTKASVAWGLGSYQFTRYRAAKRKPAQWLLPSTCNRAEVISVVSSLDWIRDLINMPSGDMSPKHLSLEAQKLVKPYRATVKQIVGKNLLKQNYPAVHAVGRCSTNLPRLIDLRWGALNAPKVTLVGKGVCFDSGGLDLKSSDLMALMKKDMGGAAHVLGLAKMIMEAKLPVRLRVLIPAVENVVSDNAYRPGEIITMRNGETVEVTNTDAEGRLILADALVEASSEKPELIIDFATLTGAARAALGIEIAAMFCNQDSLAEDILACAKQEGEAMWRMPLYAPYRDFLKSSIADKINCPNSRYAGAITAALFLQDFINSPIDWIHFDIMAYNLSDRPGKPEGGEAQGVLAVFSYLKGRFGLRQKRASPETRY